MSLLKFNLYRKRQQISNHHNSYWIFNLISQDNEITFAIKKFFLINFFHMLENYWRFFSISCSMIIIKILIYDFSSFIFYLKKWYQWTLLDVNFNCLEKIVNECVCDVIPFAFMKNFSSDSREFKIYYLKTVLVIGFI